ncbi:MAG: MFS transporter [Candidatus Dormibacteraceae bacterium]
MHLTIVRPLKHRDFRLLFIGQSVSLLGNQLYFVALPFQILALHGSPLQLGTGFAIFSGAQLLTVLFGGALVDRLHRRNVVLAVDLISAVVVGFVAALGLAHRLEIPYLYALSAFFGATFSFYQPAMSAIMPELIPSDVLVPGNALLGLSRRTGSIIGPVLGGVIVSTAGPPWAFAVDAFSFAFSFAVFFFSTPPRREAAPRKHLLAEIRDGVTFTFSVTWIWVAIIGFALSNGFYFAGFTVALPLLVLKVLMGNAATYGLIGASAGVGELVGGLIVGSIHVRRVGVGIYMCSGLLGLAFAAYGIAPKLPVVLIAAFAFAMMIVVANTLWEATMQSQVPGHLIGRVSSVDEFGSFLIGPVAPVLSAVAITQIGPGPIFIIGGLISFAIWMVALALVRQVRELRVP